MTSANPLTLKRSWGYILVALAYLLVNLFEIGGDAFLIQLNGNIGNPLALGVTVLAVLLWRRLRSGNQDRRLWFLLALGWALWTVAEFWWGIANLLGNEVPYPSGADAFWVVGYLPIAVALLARLRRLPTNLRPAQAIAIGLCIILCIGWTVHFVLIPTIESNEPAAWLQNTLNLLYPLLDFLLLILVLRILFQYQQGQYGKVWFWIAGGFVLHSLSGLFFVYATTAGLYYPDGQANPLSTLAVDATYNLGYAAMLYGLAIALSVHRTYRSLQHTRILLERVPNVHCLVFTRGDDRVVDVSHNFNLVFSGEAVQGKTLAEVLGMTPESADRLQGELKLKKQAAERSYAVKTSAGQEYAAVSAITAVSQGEDYQGGIFLLRLQRPGLALDAALTAYEQDLLASLMERVGIHEENEMKHTLANYYLAAILPFYRQVYQEGGGVLADAFLTELQGAARQHGWQLALRPDAILQTDGLPLAQARQALPAVFEAARQFVGQVIDEEAVGTILQDAHGHLDAALTADIRRYLGQA